MENLTHINKQGRAKMVDVGDKVVTERIAVASGVIMMKNETLRRIKDGGIKKGDVLTTAQIAGIMAAKNTYSNIPMCHNIALEGCDISFEFVDGNTIKATAATKATAKTGVEMEAIFAVSTALITIYDMAKAIDRDMTIGEIQLEKKSGGKSGEYIRSK
ncbi:cyclic pyranopterin monophosphate synthase MoaC [bacterium]|nr:cyclic pyranopterin monophosphate synthase MoaC [bacterium]